MINCQMMFRQESSNLLPHLQRTRKDEKRGRCHLCDKDQRGQLKSFSWCSTHVGITRGPSVLDQMVAEEPRNSYLHSGVKSDRLHHHKILLRSSSHAFVQDLIGEPPFEMTG
jgi:hypothetical protein